MEVESIMKIALKDLPSGLDVPHTAACFAMLHGAPT